jgi:hypothetical protein
VGVSDDRIGDVAHEGPFHSAEPAAAYHYQVDVYLLGEVDDRFVSPFAHPEVGDRDAATRLLDLPDLFVEYLLSLAPEVFAPRLGVNVVDGRRKRAPDRDDVEPRPDLLREVDRRPGGKLRVRRTVCGQQDPRGESTQPAAFRGTRRESA